MTDAHLISACAAIQRVLARRHPEHDWIVEVAGGGPPAPVPRDASAPGENAPNPTGRPTGTLAASGWRRKTAR